MTGKWRVLSKGETARQITEWVDVADLTDCYSLSGGWVLGAEGESEAPTVAQENGVRVGEGNRTRA